MIVTGAKWLRAVSSSEVGHVSLSQSRIRVGGSQIRVGGDEDKQIGTLDLDTMPMTNQNLWNLII